MTTRRLQGCGCQLGLPFCSSSPAGGECRGPGSGAALRSALTFRLTKDRLFDMTLTNHLNNSLLNHLGESANIEKEKISMNRVEALASPSASQHTPTGSTMGAESLEVRLSLSFTACAFSSLGARAAVPLSGSKYKRQQTRPYSFGHGRRGLCPKAVFRLGELLTVS